MTKDIRSEKYFLFTQYSLATFKNCPLKFKKRYLENIKWDSSSDKDVIKRIERGNNFHLLAYRYFLGIDEGLDEFSEEFIDLNEWLCSLKESFKLQGDKRYLPEYKLRMTKGFLKLEANYDLLIVDGDSIQIWDWKTHDDSKNKKINSKCFVDSLQTIVYMFVLKEQIQLILGKEVNCEQISMFYWQPNPKKIIAEIRYNEELHQKYKRELESIIENIIKFDYSNFNKDIYKNHCKFCEFTRFCNKQKLDLKAIASSDDFIEGVAWDSLDEIF